MANLCRSTVAIIRCRLNYNGNTGRTVALIGDLLVYRTICAACLLDNAVDIIIRDIERLSLGDKVAQLGV